MNASIEKAWARTVRLAAGRVAVIDASTGVRTTFGEVAARASAWRARHATEAQAWRGRGVVFSAPNGVGWLEIFLGLRQAGAIPVPLDPAEPPIEQQRVSEQLRAAWWDGVALRLAARPRRWRQPAAGMIKVTSGSTGLPRPLVFADAQLLADERQVTATMGIGPRDLNYALIPFGHSYGLGNLVLPLIARGVSVVCATSPLPHAIAGDFARWRPTVFPGVPALWRALASSDLDAGALASLRLPISAGAPLAPEVAREFASRFGRRLRGFYGSSETGGIAFDRSGRATLAGGVGRAMRGVSITPLRNRRIRVASPAVLTAGNGTPGAWVPPDLIEFDAAGGLCLRGRRGRMAKIGGRRVNLGEVAARLRRLPGVREVWVAVDAGAEGVLGAALATDRPLREIQELLRADTVNWKLPRRWLALAELPLTARGKIDSVLLREQLFRGKGGTRN